MKTAPALILVSLDRKSSALSIGEGTDNLTRRSVERALQAIGVQPTDISVFDQIYQSIRTQNPHPQRWRVPTRFRTIEVTQQMIRDRRGRPASILLTNPARKVKRS